MDTLYSLAYDGLHPSSAVLWGPGGQFAHSKAHSEAPSAVCSGFRDVAAHDIKMTDKVSGRENPACGAVCSEAGSAVCSVPVSEVGPRLGGLPPVVLTPPQGELQAVSSAVWHQSPVDLDSSPASVSGGS